MAGTLTGIVAAQKLLHEGSFGLKTYARIAREMHQRLLNVASRAIRERPARFVHNWYTFLSAYAIRRRIQIWTLFAKRSYACGGIRVGCTFYDWTVKALPSPSHARFDVCAVGVHHR